MMPVVGIASAKYLLMFMDEETEAQQVRSWPMSQWHHVAELQFERRRLCLQQPQQRHTALPRIPQAAG